YEGMLLRLQHINPFCRVLALSATLGNVAVLAKYLNAVSHVATQRRIPLTWRIRTFKNAKDKHLALFDELEAVEGQTLCFVQSRRRAEELSKRVGEGGYRSGYHHAGLTQKQRIATEQAFRKGELDFLSCTPTLELGVNLPARRVIIYDLRQWTGADFEPLSVTSVWQRAGRAGRPGLDTQGEVVLIAPRWETSVAEEYLKGRFEPVVSGLSSLQALAEQVVVTVSSGYARSYEQLDRFFGRSLAAAQNRLGNTSEVVALMLEAGMLLECDEVEGRLRATRLGHVASRHMLSPLTVLLFERARQRCPELAFFDLLLLACAAPDCQPVIPVDFQELDALGEAIETEGSYLLQWECSQLESFLGITGRRLLSALKMAQVLRDWSRKGDAGDVAKQRNLMPFEVVRLTESVSRMLAGLAAVLAVRVDAEADIEPLAIEEAIPLYERLVLLQRMTVTGLDEVHATLALIPGIGPRWARNLFDMGVSDIEELAGADVEELAAVRGLSRRRAQAWIDQAEELVVVRDALAFREPDVPRARVVAAMLPQGVDLYRLRRAMELSVESMDAKTFYVSGGSDPHWVQNDGDHWTCDCGDHDWHGSFHLCKHLLAVRLLQKDPELLQAVDSLEGLGTGLRLHVLWQSKDRIADPYGIAVAEGRVRR
ncbi:MAG: helicase-related protein, partial [Desulfuromonadales bacterium]|nr:helicase-related protein [Desulfuromonadales bacterium]